MKITIKKVSKEAYDPRVEEPGLIIKTTGFEQKMDNSNRLVLEYKTGLIASRDVEIRPLDTVAAKSIMFCNPGSIVKAGNEIVIPCKVITDAIPTVYAEGEEICRIMAVGNKLEPVIEEYAEPESDK